MSMTRAVTSLAPNPIRGQTINWRLTSTPAYDGTETVTCAIKLAINGAMVPLESAAVVRSVTPSFVAAAGDIAAHWFFSISAAQSADLVAAAYVTDARIVYSDGQVIQAPPLLINLEGRVTA